MKYRQRAEDTSPEASPAVGSSNAAPNSKFPECTGEVSEKYGQAGDTEACRLHQDQEYWRGKMNSSALEENILLM